MGREPKAECEMVQAGEGLFRCARCRRTHRAEGLRADQIHLVCRVQGAGRKFAAVDSTECIHRGAELRRQQCQTCQGNVQVKVFACSLLGECTLEKPIGAAVCSGCNHRAPPCRLEFLHGLGDAIQATSLIAHLRRYYPDRPIAVRCRPGQEGLFAAHGCAIGFEGRETHAVEWRESGLRSLPATPSTKLEACLLDEFGLEPIAELCRYVVEPPAEMLARAREEVTGYRLQGTAGKKPSASADCNLSPVTCPLLFLQWYGSSCPDKKNLDPEQLAAIVAGAIAAGYAVLLWDPDGRGPWRAGQGVSPGVSPPVCPPEIAIIGYDVVRRIANQPPDAVPDAMGLIALLAACDRVVSIDSGPGLACQALSNAGQGVPTLVVWTKHHPIHYACPAPDVTHLVPADHRQFAHRPIDVGLSYFEREYSHRTYEAEHIAMEVVRWIEDKKDTKDTKDKDAKDSASLRSLPSLLSPPARPSAPPFRFIVPMGIGDVSWVYSKIRHLRELTGRETILYCPAADNPKRGGDLIELLPDVRWGGYIGAEDSQAVLSQSLPASWPAKMGTWEFLVSPHARRLAANLHLESGRKLAEWLPCLATDYHYAINIPEACLDEAAGIMHGAGPLPIAVYVSGRDKDQHTKSGWSLWDEGVWAKVLCRIAEWPECRRRAGQAARPGVSPPVTSPHPNAPTGPCFVFLGAEYDRDKTEAVAALVESQGHAVRRVIARPLGTALACLRACRYALAYPSGIGVLANVLRVPAVMLLPWCLTELAETYADPCDIAARRYRAWPDPRPGEVLDWLRRVSFPAVGIGP